MHVSLMQLAFNLAKKRGGLTGSNPSVGCVVVRSGEVISSGITDFGGRPHAEFVAISKPNVDFKGAELYVTLEPCFHFAGTPPCVNKIIEAGISRVFIGCLDPDSRVSGRGAEALRAAGVTVITGVLEEEIAQFYAPYFTSRIHERSYVSAKFGVSLDGKIATFTTNSRWITPEHVRYITNWQRHKYNGIMVGGGTFRADSPALTCRVAGLEGFSPKRFIASSSLESADGFEVVRGSPAEALRQTYRSGVNHLLLEGGARLFTAFLKAGLIDDLTLIYSPILIGADGLPFSEVTGISEVSSAIKLQLIERTEAVGCIIAKYKL